MTTPYVFVYGTLRPGGRLARYWEGMADPWMADGAWRLPDYRLVGTGFPFALYAPGQQTVGSIIRMVPGQEEDLFAVLDSIEGVVGGLYERIVGGVYLAHNPEFQVQAWFYRPPDPERHQGGHPVLDNDWVAHTDARAAAEEARWLADSDWCDCDTGPTYAGTVRCAECWGRIKTGVPADL